MVAARKKGNDIVNSHYLAEYFGVKYQTILHYRKYKGLPWFHERVKNEFGTRNKILFRMRAVRIWSRKNNIKVARGRVMAKAKKMAYFKKKQAERKNG